MSWKSAVGATSGKSLLIWPAVVVWSIFLAWVAVTSDSTPLQVLAVVYLVGHLALTDLAYRLLRNLANQFVAEKKAARITPTEFRMPPKQGSGRR